MNTMKPILQKVISGVLGDASRFPLQHRILNATNALTAIILMIAVVMNSSVGLSIWISATCLLFAILCGVLWYQGRMRLMCKQVVPFTISLILIMEPIIYFMGGGSDGGILYYMSLSIMASILIIEPHQRIRVTGLFLFEITAQLMLESVYPDLVIPYPSSTARVGDILSSMLLASFGYALGTIIIFDNFRAFKGRLVAEKRRTDKLLRSSMPKNIASQLLTGSRMLQESHADVSVMFAEIVNFSQLVSSHDPRHLIPALDTLFSRFDSMVTKLNLEKVKSVGEVYMVVAGIPGTRRDHGDACCELAEQMLAVTRSQTLAGAPIALRIGIHTGPVTAGVIGKLRMHYDLWGSTVNIAARLQTICEPGFILVSDTTNTILGKDWNTKSLGLTDIRGVGLLRTYSVLPKSASLA